MTLTELLASPTLSPQRRAFYEKLRLRFAVLPVTEDAALAGVAAARRVGGAKAPDVMIAGVALEHGLRVLTADADFARLIGDAADGHGGEESPWCCSAPPAALVSYPDVRPPRRHPPARRRSPA